MPEYTKLLMHFDGADASTSFTDEIGHAFTASGSAQLDTAQYKFSPSSGLFTLATSDYITTPDHADWRLDDGADANLWTIDFWTRYNGDPGSSDRGFISQFVDDNNHWSLHFNGSIRFRVMSGGTNIIDLTYTHNPADATWYHYALVKNGTTGYLFFVDGVQVGTTTVDTSVIPDFAGALNVGRAKLSTSSYAYHNGWIDEMRISKGIARWTSSPFTPDTSPYDIGGGRGAILLGDYGIM